MWVWKKESICIKNKVAIDVCTGVTGYQGLGNRLHMPKMALEAYVMQV